MPPRPPAPTLAEISPMLLMDRKTVPTTGDWHFEIKYDGYRLLATTGQVELKSRGGVDATKWFPELRDALSALPAGSILDGEVCVLTDLGISDFERLHRRAARRGRHVGADPVAYCIFDLIVTGGRDLRAQPIEKRKAALKKLLTDPPAGLLYVADVDDGEWLYDNALALSLEGIVGKRAGSTYQAGARSPDWVKVKRPGAVPAQRFGRPG
jgi:bifunctional non-homologous end joining protein LigD